MSDSDMLARIGREYQTPQAVLEEFRRAMEGAVAHRPPVINDRLRPPPGSRKSVNDASVRILAPSLLPDAAWFAALNRWRGKQELPTGTEMGAWLGSGLATGLAAKRDGPGFAAFVRAAAAADDREYSPQESLPKLYYWTLEALFDKPDPAAPAFMGGEAWQRKSLQTALAGWAQLRHTWELQAKFNELYFGMELRPSGFVEPNPEFFRRMGVLVSFAVDRLMGAGVFSKLPADPHDQDSAGRALWERWRSLEHLTQRLEVLAQKELRGMDWDADDAAGLKNYGGTLGNIMGYAGNSWLTPRDDAPRWTSIAHDPGTHANLAVAVGRPQALYVLYPWKSRSILCCGAVMSYYEYLTPRRLTDKEWKDRLNRQNPPSPPDWLRPLLPPSRKIAR